ncbi:DNA-3-methyladenine glycosylase I [Weeksellaceae bacterium KMM 9713]|uniref:DNA-3-methyladenine glycosylase I n=1 Tax=Profundicola chukchiensis TaxID=2961959 RepID=A0A9X4MW36_9FLAO|nr:DNA-3-methyladenine glycosylase I [Profundicola chukchiensis]MDG4945138.1 DNA-3-methyladenine glycosylase I [Profundicola chukchiensis]
MENKIRCAWAEAGDEKYIAYHDNEWGKPVHDDQTHYEFLVLESFQSGLSWKTILNKRDNFRKAFADFDYKKVAKFTEDKVQELLQNQGIVRNQLKIRAAINNAQRFQEVRQEFGSFDSYIWSFTNNKVIIGHWKNKSEVPATTDLSDRVAKDLKKRGFKFLGSTTVYAYLQATGIINDHTTDCFCYKNE